MPLDSRIFVRNQERVYEKCSTRKMSDSHPNGDVKLRGKDFCKLTMYLFGVLTQTGDVNKIEQVQKMPHVSSRTIITLTLVHPASYPHSVGSP